MFSSTWKTAIILQLTHNSMKVITFCITDIRWWVKNKQVCLVYAINPYLLKAKHLRVLNITKKIKLQCP